MRSNRHSDGITAISAGALLLERARFIVRQTEQARADVMAEVRSHAVLLLLVHRRRSPGALFWRLSQVYLSLYPDVKLRFYEGVGHLANWLTSPLRIFIGEPDDNDVTRQTVAEAAILIGARSAVRTRRTIVR